LNFDFFSSKLVFNCKKGKRDLSNLENIENIEIECDFFDSKYIEYPLEISGIEMPEDRGIREISKGQVKTGSLVAVRPCAEEYGDKTYLGFFLGDVDIGVFVSHQKESKMLNISRDYNPAMFIPSLGKIIYGMGSWWTVIQNERELRAITDDDIDNVWYVKALKSLQEEPKIIYVFAVSKKENDKITRRVTITTKTYWLEHHCCKNSHLEDDEQIEDIMDELDLVEMMEGICETFVDEQSVVQKLSEHPNFEFIPEFQAFVDKCI
jgi:hypothetical protein